ncbi:MAG: YeeE/YedE family protein [Bdellovibrio sp.]|nr:YeeE/YedE family protein [Bdellovibrio sp.]
MENFYLPLIGGILIGVAVSLMLYLNGRVTGVSGIIYSAAILPIKGDRVWRWYFIGGMLIGGFILKIFKPDAFTGGLPTEDWTLVIAGLLVGFGTVLGSGCTSGHGVCGTSRLSPRSITATITFILTGVVAVYVFRKLGIFE